MLEVLRERGLRVVDLDDPGWSHEVADGAGGIEQLWNEPRVEDLLAERLDAPLVVSGCARNQVVFYDRFDAVCLIDVPEDVMLDRIATRSTNSFGRSSADRDRILADARLVVPLLRRSATVVIDGTQPLARVADEVEALTRHGRGPDREEPARLGG